MPAATSWILTFRPVTSCRLRLLCFPYAGGGASVFREWPGHLPPGVEVAAVQPPGRENRFREAPHTAMGPLVRDAARALRPCLDVPFALFGHSLGALVAFELARQLRRERAPAPACLFVSGCAGPQPSGRSARPLHQLPRDEFIAELRRLKGTPEGVFANAELLDLVLPVLRADFAVLETYHLTAEEPLTCPIVALGGREDEQASRDDLAAWAGQTMGAFQLHLFEGDHFFLRTARESLLQIVNRILLSERS